MTLTLLFGAQDSACGLSEGLQNSDVVSQESLCLCGQAINHPGPLNFLMSCQQKRTHLIGKRPRADTLACNKGRPVMVGPWAGSPRSWLWPWSRCPVSVLPGARTGVGFAILTAFLTQHVTKPHRSLYCLSEKKTWEKGEMLD